MYGLHGEKPVVVDNNNKDNSSPGCTTHPTPPSAPGSRTRDNTCHPGRASLLATLTTQQAIDRSPIHRVEKTEINSVAVLGQDVAAQSHKPRVVIPF